MRAPNHAGPGPGFANSVDLWFSSSFVGLKSPHPPLPAKLRVLDVPRVSPCSGAASLLPPTREPRRGMLEPEAKSL